MAITKKAVDQQPPNSILWDGRIAGFGVRRQGVGRPTYFLKYRAGRGRKARLRWVTIGKHGSPWTPDTARIEAQRLLAMVNAPSKSVDPAQMRDVEKRAGDVATLAEAFQAAHVAKWRPSTVESNRRLFKRHIVGVFGRWRPNDITYADVARWHVSLAKTPGAANRALAMLGSMFSWAIKNGMRDPPNPCRDIAHYRGRKVERYLTAQELARLSTVLKDNEAKDPYGVAAIRLLLFTGARLGEVLGLRWDWVDLENGLILLPDSKTGAKAIYLNKAAIGILAALPRMKDNPYVIVGLKPGTSLVNLQKPWRRLRREAGLADVRLHDLRHSFASTGASLGEGLPIIGNLLGHRSTATTARYAHLSAAPVRAANEKIGAQIAAAMSGQAAKATNPAEDGDANHLAQADS